LKFESTKILEQYPDFIFTEPLTQVRPNLEGLEYQYTLDRTENSDRLQQIDKVMDKSPKLHLEVSQIVKKGAEFDNST
jgi:hypothetical protein